MRRRRGPPSRAAASRPKPPKPPAVTEPLKPLWRPGPRYDQVLYGAGTWGRRWRVLIKADMVFNGQREPKLNVRFVLTDIGGSPRRVYERIYCGRGDAENRLKELKAGLGLDRTSCHRFLANQFRVLLAAAAYALMQELRWQARETEFARAQGAAAAGLPAEDRGAGASDGAADRAAPAAGSAGGGGVGGDRGPPGRGGPARSGRLKAQGKRGDSDWQSRGGAVRPAVGAEPVRKRVGGRPGPSRGGGWRGTADCSCRKGGYGWSGQA